LERLYEICKICFKIVKPYNIGRVIARPFLGENLQSFLRTPNRRDFSISPHRETLLDKFCNIGGKVIAVGKVSDIYAHRGITKKVTASGNKNLFNAMLKEIQLAEDNSIVFTNLIDFDMKFGHRRDVPGYAKALEDFDSWIPELINILKEDDLAIITADHGCDPTWHGHDHTREYVPILAFGPKIKKIPLGIRDTFSDVGQTIAKHLKMQPLNVGKPFF
jgi:phosphopentomutase